jgi:hypothetical protein
MRGAHQALGEPHLDDPAFTAHREMVWAAARPAGHIAHRVRPALAVAVGPLLGRGR